MLTSFSVASHIGGAIMVRFRNIFGSPHFLTVSLYHLPTLKSLTLISCHPNSPSCYKSTTRNARHVALFRIGSPWQPWPPMLTSERFDVWSQPEMCSDNNAFAAFTARGAGAIAGQGGRQERKGTEDHIQQIFIILFLNHIFLMLLSTGLY